MKGCGLLLELAGCTLELLLDDFGQALLNLLHSGLPLRLVLWGDVLRTFQRTVLQLETLPLPIQELLHVNDRFGWGRFALWLSDFPACGLCLSLGGFAEFVL